LLIVPDTYYPNTITQINTAANNSSEPMLAAIEAVVAMAEVNPEAARVALWRLQTDWKTLARMEERLGGEPTQAALKIGAAIYLARMELASPSPQLRQRLVPEIMEWLGRRELSTAE